MSVGLLDFFVLEASDLVERLQRATTTDEPQGPDAAILSKLARELRGSATMARLTGFAAASAGLERVARLLQEGRIAWTPALAAVVTDAVAELRSLIPMARLWSESHDQRARAAGDRLQAVLDAVEQHGALMQSGAGAASASAPPAESPTTTPRTGMAAMSDAHMPIVPIASLAPAGDVASVLYRAPNPAIGIAQRFIADISPLIGSLRARLAPLRHGAMQQASVEMVAAFRPVLLSLRDTAASYEQSDIHEFCEAVLSARAPLPAAAAGAIDTALSVMLQPDLVGHVRAQKLSELRRVVSAATPLASGVQSEPTSRRNDSFTPHTPLRATPAAPPRMATTSRPTPAAPSGRELSALLSTTLAKVGELDATPLDLLAIPQPVGTLSHGEPDVVPIDALLYRGPRALARARLLVGQLRTGNTTGNPALIEELFDLVDLAGSTT